MLIPHRGKGVFVLVIGVVAAVLMNALTFKLFGDDYYQRNAWPKVGTLWLAALGCLLLGAYLRGHPPAGNTRAGRRDDLPSDRKSGLLEKGARIAPKDHLCFVPVIYWGAIYFLLGVVYACVKLAGSG